MGVVHKRRRRFFQIFDTSLPHVGSFLVLSVSNFDQFLTPCPPPPELLTSFMDGPMGGSQKSSLQIPSAFHKLDEMPHTTKKPMKERRTRDVGEGWASWVIVYPGFGISVNPITTRGGRLRPPPKLLLAQPPLSSFLRHCERFG